MIFPLREGDLHEVASFLKQTRLEGVFEDKLAEEWSSKAWQYVVFCCLNRLAGAAACPLKGRWTLSERRAAASIAGYVESRLARDHRGAGLSEEAWQKDLASRQVGYGGEEVSICHKLSWEQVLPGLPPETHGGCVTVWTGLVQELGSFFCHPKLWSKMWQKFHCLKGWERYMPLRVTF